MALSGVDTIVAAATPRGVSALAVVRLSGPEAISIADQVFSSASLRKASSHSAHVGFVRSASGQDIDQVVATLFRTPTSATGEDVVEFSCHGGTLAADALIEQLIETGARPAKPGEFTQRAFVNGKMDLAQAEAVADLIHGRSSRAHRVSLSHLEGSYSRLLDEIRSELLELVSLLELELDFSDEDVEFANRDRLETLLRKGLDLIEELVQSYRFGRVVRDGVVVAIGGKPNAGKSTLLNALVGYDRAIVSDTPGTTRDELEAELEFDGLRIRFVDTAGLRESEDSIEAEGVRRARERFLRSDVLLYLIDLTTDTDPEELKQVEILRNEAPDLEILVLANKRDLVQDEELNPGLHIDMIISASILAREPRQAEKVLRTITETVVQSGNQVDEHRIVTNGRHRAHLSNARTALHRARSSLSAGTSGDLISADIRVALDEIGMITGQITNEDVLDQIFSRFCIGK